MLVYAEALLAILCFFLLFLLKQCRRKPLLLDWPIFGMLPQLLLNLRRFHDSVTWLLKQRGSTWKFKGPWFVKMNYLVTCDPMNVHHVMSKNFGNYVKGSEFREIFEAFGDGIFTADSDAWKHNRALLHSIFKQKNFQVFLEKLIHSKMKSSLLPLLDHIQNQGIQVDLQDIFNRFTFDSICSIVLGFDANCLSIDFPEVACEKAFNEAGEAIFYRQAVPRCIWKFQKWLQIGEEKKMSEACETFDHFLRECITLKCKGQSKYGNSDMEELQDDLLTSLLKEELEKGETVADKFLRDTAFNLLVAGRDTISSGLTWFFWLVATHPSVEAKILEEIKDKFAASGGKEMILGVEDVKKLVYLHGAICEALRLFPPLPFQRKQAIKRDILPSGHQIDSNETIFISFYTMGRSEEIWGKDCLQFKPERWISKGEGIIHVPSYKFVSFNAGPRTCLGKGLSFFLMKMVASAILWNFHMEVVKDHPISPSLSIILSMKHGLKVKISKRGT